MAQTLHPDLKGVLKYRFRIQRIGVEMEGAWTRKQDKLDPKTGAVLERAWYPKIKEDPSVRHFENVRDRVQLAAIGEVVSEPLIRADLWKWMDKNNPDHVNQTCGLHVHMSFRHELDYQQLMDRSYHDHMIMGLWKWGLKHVPKTHHFWPRLRGTNLFAQDVFHADHQVYHRGGSGGYHDNRYGIVNFPWSQHKTVEIRVLPMFEDKKLNQAAVRRVLNLTEEYLDGKRATRDPARELRVSIPTEIIIPIRAVKDIPGLSAEPHVKFQVMKYTPGSRTAGSMLKTAAEGALKEVFYADPFLGDDAIESLPVSKKHRWYPFTDSDAIAYGVQPSELVEAFMAHEPFGGWQDYPSGSTMDRIISWAQDRASERVRRERQVERMLRPRAATPRPVFVPVEAPAQGPPPPQPLQPSDPDVQNRIRDLMERIQRTNEAQIQGNTPPATLGGLDLADRTLAQDPQGFRRVTTDFVTAPPPPATQPAVVSLDIETQAPQGFFDDLSLDPPEPEEDNEFWEPEPED